MNDLFIEKPKRTLGWKCRNCKEFGSLGLPKATQHNCGKTSLILIILEEEIKHVTERQ